MSQLFASGGQSTGVSASASVLPMNIQDWSSSSTIGFLKLWSCCCYFPDLCSTFLIICKICYFKIVTKKLWEFTYIFHVDSLNDNTLLNLLYYSFSYINKIKIICV